MSSSSYLIQILLPKETGKGETIPQAWFEALLRELTDKFGGATSFVQVPGQGLWRSRDEVERETVAVVEVMAEGVERPYWGALRQRLERELSQNEIVIRALEINRL